MVEIFKNTEELSLKAAEIFCQTAIQSVQANGRFVVALTGGSSPEKMYKLLAGSPFAEQVPWDKTFAFWADERWVPLTDERSNAKMTFETLLNHVPIPKHQIFPMWAEQQPNEFALKYEEQLKSVFEGQYPQFDLVLLGMGDDGHTASLFPGTEVLHEQTSLVMAYYLRSQWMHRITLTAPCINAANKIVFIAFGEKKARALHEVLEGTYNPDKYPAQLIKPANHDAIWLVDEAAASQLSK